MGGLLAVVRLGAADVEALVDGLAVRVCSGVGVGAPATALARLVSGWVGDGAVGDGAVGDGAVCDGAVGDGSEPLAITALGSTSIDDGRS